MLHGGVLARGDVLRLGEDVPPLGHLVKGLGLGRYWEIWGDIGWQHRQAARAAEPNPKPKPDPNLDLARKQALLCGREHLAWVTVRLRVRLRLGLGLRLRLRLRLRRRVRARLRRRVRARLRLRLERRVRMGASCRRTSSRQRATC